MDLNATLILQMIVFAVFIWVTMRYIWPPLTQALEARRKTIADGLAAAEKAQHDLELAQHKVQEQLTEVKAQAAHIVEQAHQRANHIIEESKSKAREEGDRLLQLAQAEVAQEYHNAKEQLMKQVGSIAVAAAEKILRKEINQASNDRLIEEMLSDV